MSPIRKEAIHEAYKEYPSILEDVNNEPRNGFIEGYHAALDNVSDELNRILSISTMDSLADNIRIFIKELDDTLEELDDILED